jgi:hypothetical protein
VQVNPKAKPTKPTGAPDIDTPAARYCLELIEQGLIHPGSGSKEIRSGHYEISEQGRARATEKSKPHGDHF